MLLKFYFLSIVAIATFLFIQNEKTKSEESRIERIKKRNKFDLENEKLRSLIQKAVKVEFKGIENDSLIFTIKNNTNQKIKNIQYEGYFKDDFGTNLESKSCSFSYKAISKELAVQPYSKLETSISFWEISRIVYFDINKYKDNFTIDFETTQFTLISGEKFSANWAYSDMPYVVNDGPKNSIAQIKEFLK